MNYAYLHRLTFDALYVCIAVSIFVIIERSLYLSYLSLRSGRLSRLFDRETPAGVNAALVKLMSGDPISASIKHYAALLSHTGVSRDQLEDYSSALFIVVDKKISARLWVLDTMITAAPLLGLLGTILGIMETFTAFAQGGVSDPGEVSRGIGTALVATAIGIATALLGLFGTSILSRRAHLLVEDFKSFLLRLAPVPG